jgi:hypothetical protein
MTTVIFACPKCGLAHKVTQVLAARPSVWIAAVATQHRSSRLKIRRHLRDRQIQGDVAEPRHRSTRHAGKLT